MRKHKGGINVVFGGSEMTLVGAAYQAKTVNFCALFCGYEDVLPWKLPAVGHIALGAYVTLVPVEKVYQAKFGQFFQLFEAFYLEAVEFGIGFSFAPSPDSFVASAKAFKKRRNTSRLTVRPDWAASHSALAMSTRCRLA